MGGALFSPLPSWERVDRRLGGEPGEGALVVSEETCNNASHAKPME
jgi:hypothetical protein